MFQSIWIAFSTYSKIPTPRTKWDDKGMRFCMCAFPLVGVVIGCLYIGLAYLCLPVLHLSHLMATAVLTVLPLLVTGGIHMDGLLDTMDARSSYKPMAEKLQILKDPHTGAFAILYGLIYIVLYYGATGELLSAFVTLSEGSGKEAVCFLSVPALGFVYERILSGLSVVLFRKAKKDGMAVTVSKQADKPVAILLFVEMAVCVCAMCVLKPLYGAITVATGLLVFFYYRRMAYKTFGGITGDLAGYFLQMCELMMLMVYGIVHHF